METKKLTFEWAMQTDGSRALIFDAATWDVFESVAHNEGKNPYHLISAAVAQCLGSMKVDDYIRNRSTEH